MSRLHGNLLRVATRAQELGYKGHIVAGGHFTVFNAQAILRNVPAIDSIWRGEGAQLMCDLADSLENLSTVTALMRRGNKRRIKNP